MLKEYSPKCGRNIHTVRVTFMRDDYVGHIAFEVRGNCRGGSLLDTDFLDCDTQEDIDRYVENDCYFQFYEGEGYYDESYYLVTLINSDGDGLKVSGDSDEMKGMIIRIEIMNVRSQDECGGTA